MNRHELPDADPEATQPNRAVQAKKIERKVSVATAVAGGLGGLLAVLNAIQASPGLIAGLPKSWQSVIFIAVPLILVFAAGYAVPSNRV
jgi:type IV secretory pathway VirB2 component (pilin)